MQNMLFDSNILKLHKHIYSCHIYFYFIVPCSSPYLGKAQQLQEQHHLFLPVCSICMRPNNGMAASVWDF